MVVPLPHHDSNTDVWEIDRLVPSLVAIVAKHGMAYFSDGWRSDGVDVVGEHVSNASEKMFKSWRWWWSRASNQNVLGTFFIFS